MAQNPLARGTTVELPQDHDNEDLPLEDASPVPACRSLRIDLFRWMHVPGCQVRWHASLLKERPRRRGSDIGRLAQSAAGDATAAGGGFRKQSVERRLGTRAHEHPRLTLNAAPCHPARPANRCSTSTLECVTAQHVHYGTSRLHPGACCRSHLVHRPRRL